MKKRPTYLRAIVEGLETALKGMRLSGKHLLKGYDRAAPLGIADPDYFKKETGPITIQYPKEKVPIPDTGRYRLHMETDDCIGCDKCARICPVDCITIETFRADGDLGKTSDGTVKRLHLPTFDIDMAKCMYCGLCTTVCPTECLTMTPVYDYSEFDRDNFVYHFGAYSPEEDLKIRMETDLVLAAKKAAKAEESTETAATPVRRRPVINRAAEVVEEKVEKEEKPAESPPPRRRPVMKRDDAPTEDSTEEKNEETPATETETPAPKKRPRPIMKRDDVPIDPAPEVSEEKPATETEAPAPKKRPRPIMKRPDTNDGGES